MTQYSSLSRAQLSYDYLHTNSTTHEFLFGALAELIDNARDASATKINVYATTDKSLRGGYMLCFLDDGEGMMPEEAADIVTFGRSSKRSNDSQLIGMYGNGLKSGSMRIGNDLMIFTKKGPVMSAVFLSRTFHEEEKIDEIIVPMPSFDSQSKKPLAKGKEQNQKHQLEMDLIYKYSPFKSEAQFMREFDRIDGKSGTLVVIYNVKLLDSGDPELDVTSDYHDVLLANPDGGDFDSDEGDQLFISSLMPERKSFRAYTSLLYVDPRMKIYINSKKVRTKRLANCLYKPRLYHYSSNRFKTRSEAEASKAKEEAKSAENRAREAESKAKNLENKLGDKGTREQRADLRKAQTHALEMRRDATIKKEMSGRKMKSLREPKSLKFVFGMNLENRNQDGMFVYNCSRLIKMYQRVGPQSDGGVFCSGVVGVVDVPYMVLEPTHNKQDFADAKEYRTLQKAMGEYMVQYWKDVGIATQGVTKFWENFGYLSTNWKESPSQDQKFARKRAMQLSVTLQCDLCLKWRMLPFAASSVGKDYPDDWICSMNPDPSHNRCSAAEQKLDIPEGVLKKEVKSKEQKEKELEDDIKKKQEQLIKIQKTKSYSSSHSRDYEDDRKVSREAVSRSAGRREPELPKRAAATSSRPSLDKNSISNSRRRSQIDSEESSESEDFADDDDDEPPKKKSRSPFKSSPRVYSRTTTKSKSPTKPIRATPTTTTSTSRRSSQVSKMDTEDSESEEDVKSKMRSRQAASRNGKEMIADAKKDTDKTLNTTEPDDGVPAASEDDDDSSQLGTKVEAKFQSKWCNGTVTQVNERKKKWKVKFDKYPQDKYDSWFDFDSSDVKIIKNNQSTAAESTVDTVRSPASVSSQETAAEAPSSSTTTTGASAINSQHAEDIANGYRTCLRYFLPPHWMMDKDSVSGLSTQELANFPLDDFFDHYEKGLRKLVDQYDAIAEKKLKNAAELVSSFQMEAQQKQTEAEVARGKLSNVRKLIAKLLKTINEEFDIDPEADTEQVDELLAACVKQALQQQTS